MGLFNQAPAPTVDDTVQGDSGITTKKISGLNSLTFPKQTVIDQLKANMATHRQAFLEALDGFYARADKELKQRMEDVKNHRKFSQHIGLPEPEDHTSEYKSIIEMLELATEDEVTLTLQEFRCYMNDQWEWRRAFLTNATSYGSTTAGALVQ